jgi:8-oxo-dGTP diphosphatase
VLVHRPKYDDWTLPKGKLEAGEDLLAAALREVREETGLACVLGPALAPVEYVDSGGNDKVVDYWAMASTTDELAPTKEIDEARWVPLADAAGQLSHERDREVLAEAKALLPGAQPVTVHLVRHARAGIRDRWLGPDGLRPLTASGRRQADVLAERLSPRASVALVSSPAVRCVQTLEPLGQRAGLPVQRHDGLAEGASGVAALELVDAAAALGDAALSTHGDVQVAVIEELVAARVPLSKPLRFAKGSTWELTVDDGRVVAGSYVPAP